ncbi:MAG: polysaccharide deacetylase family protein [Solirubrobacterales bacterium]|nr:polysaccharide deacetylase family protein [Solirubrobacterales bacterium]
MNRKAAGAVAAGAATVAAGVAIFQGQYPTAQLYGETVHREPGAGKRLCLTYDDGPNPHDTPILLDLLDRHDAKATFFLIGMWAQREPALIREIVARGHAIGNHTFTHPTMPAHSSGRIREELRRCREAVVASGEDFAEIEGMALMRPPYGRRRPGTLRTMREEGYVPITWSITGYDWRSRITAEKITSNCLKAGEGDIILLHDGSNEEPAADRSRSIEATRNILEHYRPQGYEFVTVPDLVAAAR